MNDVLQAIYDHFYIFPRNTPEEKRIEANHQRLIRRLRKQGLQILSLEEGDYQKRSN